MRGDRVVALVLAATLEEICRVGYDAVRVEGIAARARVHKTTVYRRWATKEGLVEAALSSALESLLVTEAPETGSVRDDLVAYVRSVVAATSTPAGRAISKVLVAGDVAPNVLAIARSVRSAQRAIPLEILKRARARGELRGDVDPEFFLQVLGAAYSQLVLKGEFAELSADTVRAVARIVDLLLEGALTVRPAHPRGEEGAPC